MLPPAVLNEMLSSSQREVWKADAVPVEDGRWVLTFEHHGDRWRHGVWLATDGHIEVAGQRHSQTTLWSDTAPPEVPLLAVAEDGLLHLYNVWDSGRGRARESQSATSGMVRETLPEGYRYRCWAIGPEPTFDDLVFTLTRW